MIPLKSGALIIQRGHLTRSMVGKVLEILQEVKQREDTSLVHIQSTQNSLSLTT